jgi:structural maintenance of chromosome 3 (chondroitin sulfate proteoglycan 6)
MAGEEAEAQARMNSRQLLHELHETSEALKAYGHVNKKARDQYVSFTEQRDQLIARREELTRGK